jgi:Family of unknown function (DUF6194)
MDATSRSGPDPDAITRYITETWPETIVAEAMNARFFSLDETHWPNFATIVTTDEHDDASNLARDGVFRLNIGTLSRETFRRTVGDINQPEYTELDRLFPHPVYARQRWVSIVNPSDRSFDEICKPLLAETHDRLAAQRARQPSA